MEESEFTYSEYNLAHPAKRYQGQFIDGLISMALFAGMLIISKHFSYEGEVSDILIMSIPIAYFVLSDALPNGQSIGKRILGIYVISKSTGKSCTIIQSIARNLFTPILGILDACLIFTKSRQRLGDKMANTIVVNRLNNI